MTPTKEPKMTPAMQARAEELHRAGHPMKVAMSMAMKEADMPSDMPPDNRKSRKGK